MVRIIKLPNFRLSLTYPRLTSLHEDLFDGGREGYGFQANTGFTYLEGNEERGSWFCFRILGLGLGFYWDFKGKDWEGLV